MRSASDACEDQSVVTSRNFSMLLEQAGTKCDVLIVAAPPVLISADALYLGRQADFVLHVVQWNSTPRRAVLAALDRLRNFGIPVNGVIIPCAQERVGETTHGWRKGWKDWKSFGHRMERIDYRSLGRVLSKISWGCLLCPRERKCGEPAQRARYVPSAAPDVLVALGSYTQ